MTQNPDAPEIWRWIFDWCPSDDWEDLTEGARNAFLAIARAAIEAMMEPSEAMKDEGAGIDFWNSGDGKSTTGNVESIWSAMISAALKEKG